MAVSASSTDTNLDCSLCRQCTSNHMHATNCHCHWFSSTPGHTQVVIKVLSSHLQSRVPVKASRKCPAAGKCYNKLCASMCHANVPRGCDMNCMLCACNDTVPHIFPRVQPAVPNAMSLACSEPLMHKLASNKVQTQLSTLPGTSAPDTEVLTCCLGCQAASSGHGWPSGWLLPVLVWCRSQRHVS